MRRKKKPSSRSVNPLRHKGAAGSRVTETPSPIYAHIRAAIRQIPRGKVSTYGAVARAAGFPGAARQVARALHSSVGLPWQRVLGSGGQIKLRGDSAMEQRFQLEAEGVRFRGKKVDMKAHEFRFAKKRSK
jgi:methylated-DNA-protein-cysteine methyltransferase related protein